MIMKNHCLQFLFTHIIFPALIGEVESSSVSHVYTRTNASMYNSSCDYDDPSERCL